MGALREGARRAGGRRAGGLRRRRARSLPPPPPSLLLQAHASIGLTTFGASAPANDVLAYFGFTKEAVATKGAAMLAHFKGAAPTLPVNAPTF